MIRSEEEKIEKFPISEILKGIPGVLGIQLDEEPSYELLNKFGEVEIRKYGPVICASTDAEGSDMNEVTGRTFIKLANFIFIKNNRSETLAMTSPVLVKKSADKWKMTFFLPGELLPSEAPKPLDGDVRLEAVPEKIYAVITYSGTMSESLMDVKNTALIQLLQKIKSVKIVGEPFTAQYDQPFAIPIFKKNESWVEISLV